MIKQPLYGKYVILSMLLLAVAAVIYSQMFNAKLQQRPLELWGKHNAMMMVNGPLANGMLLVPTDTQKNGPGFAQLMIGGQHLTVLAEKDVTNKPGFSHVRQSFVNENSFDWSAKTDACRPEWKYALEFSNGDFTSLLLIAPNCGFVQLAETGATASMQPVMKGIVGFMQEQFPEETK